MGYKAKSITSKASSACKINMGLVYGTADVQSTKGFNDYGGIISKGMQSSTDEVVPVETKTSNL